MTHDGRPPVGRRLLVIRLGGLAAATTLGGCVVAPPGPVVVPVGRVRTGLSDADPNDGPGYGRGGRPVARGPYTGVSDSDPSDGPGHGRRGVVRTGATDSDPNDGPGRGRGGYRTGVSDSDPSDGPGRGRGGYRRGVSDSDPSDGPGRGRGWR